MNNENKNYFNYFTTGVLCPKELSNDVTPHPKEFSMLKVNHSILDLGATDHFDGYVFVRKSTLHHCNSPLHCQLLQLQFYELAI